MLFVVAYDLYELREWRESTLTPSSLWLVEWECFRCRRRDELPWPPPPPFLDRWLRCDLWLLPPSEPRDRLDRPPRLSRSAAMERGPRALVTSSKSQAVSFPPTDPPFRDEDAAEPGGGACPDASMSMTRPSLFIRFSRRILSFASRIIAAAASDELAALAPPSRCDGCWCDTGVVVALC